VIADGVRTLYRVRMDPLEPVATVGSGDAFLAGLVSARYSGKPPDECLRYGVACGAESTQRLGAGVIDPRGVERVLPEVEVERLEQAAEVR
jgi:1-phosphofructokinase/tagatose 6-phosphate kinase